MDRAATEWDRYLREDVTGPVLRSAGQTYPGVGTALACLDWLEAHEYQVLGFEGLDCDGIHIRATTYGTNFASITGDRSERVRMSIDASRRVLSEWRGKVQFVDQVVKAP